MRSEIREITEEVEVFIADDGSEFDSRWECEDYEARLQLSKKEAAIDHLKVNLNEVDWPSICDPSGPSHEYRWYKLNNEADLKQFCDTFVAYNRQLSNYENVLSYLKFEPTYPDYICIVDFPNGGEEPRWVTLSRLIEQSQQFLSQLNNL